MTDIAPALHAAIETAFREAVKNDKSLQALLTKAETGEITYEEAYKAAERIGKLSSDALLKNLSSEVLPEGKMYYNIAERTVAPQIESGYNMAAQVAVKAQTAANAKRGTGMKAVTPELTQDKVEGIVNRLTSEESFDEVSWILRDPVETLTLDAVSDTVKANAELQTRAGLRCYIIRRSVRKCCEWYANLEGKFLYPDDLPDDVFRRHENCRCIVEYDAGDGKRTNVHTKRTYSEAEREKRIQDAKEYNQAQAEQEEKAKLERIEQEQREEEIRKEREEIKKELQQVIGEKVNGTIISGTSKHFIDQLKERNVEVDKIIDAIREPLGCTKIKQDEKGKSFKAIGAGATVTVNPDTGILITVHGTHTKTARRLKERNDGN